MSAIEVAIEKWRREGIELLPANEPAVVIAKLGRLNRPFARDLVELYTETGGMNDYVEDANCLSFWSINRVLAENARYKRPHILFADFLISSHCYCVRYKNGEQSSVAIEHFNGEEPIQVAASLEEFFEIYNNAPDKLL